MATKVHAARAALFAAVTGVLGTLGALIVVAAAVNAQPASPRIYNTVIEKLEAGRQVVGGTIVTSDPEIYCAMANAGYDFLWIEMQHSPLTYQEVARMIWACRGAPAIPFIRVPDATPGDIQKATDIGALGIIVPLVETIEEARDTVKYAKYPPEGLRSLGNGQYRALWGDDYRATANANIMVVAMIESPAGVAIADGIATVPGVDVVFAASTDLGSFSGLSQGDELYEQLVSEIADATLSAGRYLGGPQAWMNRDGFKFFQGPPEPTLIRLGVQESLRATPRGVAPTEGGRE
jgi:2-keto-3-deoxy-L-rhamnonate aldolase RhmA